MNLQPEWTSQSWLPAQAALTRRNRSILSVAKTISVKLGNTDAYLIQVVLDRGA